ncbi:OmpA family protein [Microbacterium resistens]|uniref:OmpA family protein n=2 Tax=Microbacterium resistens TaxID=156977 RepID=A0ABY3RUT5_9MICO|nr:OmpA family protein [Microbacterium resistens]
MHMHRTSLAPAARPLLCGISAGIVALALAGCSVAVSPNAAPSASAGASGTPSPAASPTPDPSPTPSVATVPGYDVGQFPPVPLFLLPDLTLLDASASSFAIDLQRDVSDIPGVTVSAAQCDAGGQVISGTGTALLYGDGSGTFTGPDGSIQNFGDGSGSFTLNGVTVQNFGDGAGNYTDGTISIQNFGDGAGNYVDATKSIQVFGDGSGNYTDGDVSIQNFGDGAGNYTDGTVTIQNFGDGAGNYTDGTVTIQNFGDGTGTVNGTPVTVEKLAPVPRLGVFPPLAALNPITSCGTTITFQDGVLFDFARSDIRPDAVPTIESVAAVFAKLGVAKAIVSGHTDAIGSDEDNQELSERRARSVVEALQQRGVSAPLEAVGYGESRPVAANEVDGADNPAGRQLNRRVEIFIPAAL